jgi:DNA-directed RNA polymerase subunit RPC12/RpoP
MNEIKWSCQRCGETTNYGKTETYGETRRYICHKCGGRTPWDEYAALRRRERNARSYAKRGYSFETYLKGLKGEGHE